MIASLWPMQDTIEVNGESAEPLYKYLKQQQPRAVPGSRFALNAEIGWNYEKV
jgi:glutathione peroxidase-family protein